MDLDEDFSRRCRAVQSRDRRFFDGQFYTAASATKIYCRPSCPEQTPEPEDVVFFSTSAAAHEHGYRACRRCLPDAIPGTPEWNIRQDLVGRAMRLIREGTVNDGGVESLSAQLGCSSTQLHGALVAELGAGPLALVRAHRLDLARTLLVSSRMSLTEIAFAAGFSSFRQFNEAVSKFFGSAPSEIHRRARPRSEPPRQSPPAASPAQGLNPRPQVRLALPVREPFDAAGVFGFLSQRAIAGVETAQLDGEALVYARTLRLAHGPGAIEVTAAPRRGDPAGPADAWQLHLECELSSLSDLPAAVGAARRIFDLDADPLAVAASLSADPSLADQVARSPGLRLPGAADGPEYLIRAIVGQQISVAAARTHLTRLVDALGTAHASSFAGLSQVFPTPEEICAGIPEPPSRAGSGPAVALDPERPLRLPARSISTVRSAARALTAGELSLHQGVDARALHDQLIAMPGIGRWTASYLMLRVLGDPDAWMTGDVVLLTAARRLGLLDPDLKKPAAHRALQAYAERWSPWRSYAAMHLWKAAAESTPGQVQADRPS